MRFYTMYYTCKNYLQSMEKLKISTGKVNDARAHFLDNWDDKKHILNELKKVPVLKPYISNMLSDIPYYTLDENKITLDNHSANRYSFELEKVDNMMRSIVKIYESMEHEHHDSSGEGFDIKLPQLASLSDLAECIKDLDFILTKCPYLRVENSEIRYNRVDIGSFWLTFLITGAAATTVLKNLAAMIDKAIAIRSHNQTVEQQKEQLRQAKLKNDVLENMIKNQDELMEVLKTKCIEELETDIHELENGEERDIAGRSISKLVELMDKGLEIYSAIESPTEIKALFPQQENIAYLTDDITKLLEMKEGKTDE